MIQTLQSLPQAAHRGSSGPNGAGEPAHRPFDLLILPTKSSLKYLDGSLAGGWAGGRAFCLLKAGQALRC